MTLQCQRDAYQQQGTANILKVERDETGWTALLDDSVLYAEGGGQPSDQGTVGGIRVRAVSAEPGGVRLHLEAQQEAAPVQPGPAELVVDWARRYDHMQQHTAQHLLTAVALDRFGWATTSFHLHPAHPHSGQHNLCDIELEVQPGKAPPEGPLLAALQEAVNAEIRAARPVRVQEMSPDALPAQVRSRGLPEGHIGPVRLVEIEGLDLNTCGGTHVANTAELQSLCLLGTERIRGGTRLFFVAGGRVLARLAASEAQNTRLSSLLSRGAHDLVIGVERLLEESKARGKAMDALQGELADALGAALAASPGPVLALHRADGDAALLNRIASVVLRARPEAILWLTAGGGTDGAFLLVTAPERLTGLKAQVLSLLEAKGGGPAGRLQGKSARLDRRDEVAVLLAGTGGQAT